MGSQENLCADAETDDNVANVGDDGGAGGSGTELQQFWRRRSRRNSLSNNDSRRNSFSAGNSNSANSSSSSLDRRSLYITPTSEKSAAVVTGSTPFGSSGSMSVSFSIIFVKVGPAADPKNISEKNLTLRWNLTNQISRVNNLGASDWSIPE